MEITFSAISAYDDSHHILTIKTENGETIRKGQTIVVQLIDESFVECEIASMRKWNPNFSKKRGKWIEVDSVSNGETCEVDIYGLIGNVQTTSIPSPEEMRRLDAMINVMPYKEIQGGEESIYDHIDESYAVPEKVIAYLKTTQPHMVCMGVYKHPFKDKDLPGPYWYTDGEYYWDRDAWKYVVKYHLTLPQAFVDKVMSEEGTAFLEKCMESDESWAKNIQSLNTRPNTLCLMPDNAGDIELEDF